MAKYRITLYVTLAFLAMSAYGGKSGSTGGSAVAVGSTPLISAVVPGDNAFWYPGGIFSDGVCLYVADTDNFKIRKVTIANLEASTLAGEVGVPGSKDNLAGTSAHFNSPCGIATDGVNLYISESGNNTIRKVVIATGAVTTVAG